MPHPHLFTPRRTLLATAVLAALGSAPHAWGQVVELGSERRQRLQAQRRGGG
ncbi:MAG: hypothetical protein U1F68_01500 [Gammaproteobacteria bacterium]